MAQHVARRPAGYGRSFRPRKPGRRRLLDETAEHGGRFASHLLGIHALIDLVQLQDDIMEPGQLAQLAGAKRPINMHDLTGCHALLFEGIQKVRLARVIFAKMIGRPPPASVSSTESNHASCTRLSMSLSSMFHSGRIPLPTMLATMVSTPPPAKGLLRTSTACRGCVRPHGGHAPVGQPVAG